MEPAEVRSHRAKKSFVRRVSDSELATRLFNDLRERGIMHVANAVEQVMLDLKVQTAQEPG